VKFFLPHTDLFQKLFRQDLLVASLFRNFLLAERIMRSYDCVPVSSPSLPPTYQVKKKLSELELCINPDLSQHPMWQAWDLALDLCLGQLPDILNNESPFEHSNFFEEQLTAFEVWLELGSSTRSPPEQLPVVLQVSAKCKLQNKIYLLN
jgi:regulatory associated protein of mTOR